FYLAFPFLLPRILAMTRVLLVTALTLSLGLSVLARTPVQGLGVWHPSSVWPWLPLPLIRLPEFLAGVLLGVLLFRSEAEQISPTGHSTRATLAALASILLLSLPIGDWVSLVVLPFAVLIYELAAERSWLARILSGKAMLLLGGASYSIYLLQYPVR